MQRPVTGFHRDEAGDWVAELACGHRRHVRHEPPFQMRAWTETEAGRREKLGALLDCVRCDRREIPDGFAPYRRTATFDERTTPAALRARHDTKLGVWARIHVLEGRLRYRVHEPLGGEEVLEPGRDGVVPSAVPHEVEPLGPVRFYVEFWARLDGAS